MPSITVLPLGAGQDVGRSCIIVSFASGRTVMLDCGMHMGYNDHRRFPDFSLITRSETLDSSVDAVLVSHFHLDHCGALPYMTERLGYTGPIIMSHPTKAICPILLEDFRKISTDRRGGGEVFSSLDIQRCMAKTTLIQVHQTLVLAEDLEVKAYYAGHVLGAVMFYVRSGAQSVLYTGDYNMTPDRHLGMASVDRCRPDLLITEATYATLIRKDSKRAREVNLQRKIVDCVRAGGNVLLPVFAIGRAQELAVLLDSVWDRLGLLAPIYFAGGMTEKSTDYYRMFASWTNIELHSSLVNLQRNAFEYKHVTPLRDAASQLAEPGGMLVFASPGMLHSGMSLEIFRRWADDPRNLVVLPGYCVPGTVGAQLLAMASTSGTTTGSPERIVNVTNSGGGGSSTVRVRLRVEQLSFSAHADAKGIFQLIRDCSPKSIMLVHGERPRMAMLKATIEQRLGINTHMPANHQTLVLPTIVIPKNAPIPYLPWISSKNVGVSKGKSVEIDDEIVLMTNGLAKRGMNSLNKLLAEPTIQGSYHLIIRHEKLIKGLPNVAISGIYLELRSKSTQQHYISTPSDCIQLLEKNSCSSKKSSIINSNYNMNPPVLLCFTKVDSLS